MEWQTSAQPPRQIESFVNTSRKHLKNRNQALPAVRNPRWKLELARDLLWAPANLPTHRKLIHDNISPTMKANNPLSGIILKEI